LQSAWPDLGVSPGSKRPEPSASSDGGPILLPFPAKQGARRVDKRVTQSRTALRQALLELLADHRLSDLSAAMIAGHAGIGYATFFRHYASPEALLLDLAEETIG
jgi:hypothetical protein